jgi:RNA polymerase sigma-70 factor (ECF subfamily)
VTDLEQNTILENWLASYKALIFKIVRSYAFNPMDREDLFQEISLQIWRSVPSFRGDCAVTTWLYRVSLNTAIRFSQRERKRAERRTDLNDSHHVLSEVETWHDERLEWLYEEISKLNEIDRSITLLMLEDFSYREMASIIGITESNIGVRINRIKKQLIERSKTYDHHGV